MAVRVLRRMMGRGIRRDLPMDFGSLHGLESTSLLPSPHDQARLLYDVHKPQKRQSLKPCFAFDGKRRAHVHH